MKPPIITTFVMTFASLGTSLLQDRSRNTFAHQDTTVLGRKAGQSHVLQALTTQIGESHPVHALNVHQAITVLLVQFSQLFVQQATSVEILRTLMEHQILIWKLTSVQAAPIQALRLLEVTQLNAELVGLATTAQKEPHSHDHVQPEHTLRLQILNLKASVPTVMKMSSVHSLEIDWEMNSASHVNLVTLAQRAQQPHMHHHAHQDTTLIHCSLPQLTPRHAQTVQLDSLARVVPTHSPSQWCHVPRVTTAH